MAAKKRAAPPASPTPAPTPTVPLTSALLAQVAVTPPPIAITDAMLRDELESLRQQHATWKPRAGAPELGDRARVTLARLTADGGVAWGGEYRQRLGDGQIIPEVEAVIAQTAPGETREYDVRWPDDFPCPEHAGETFRVRVTLAEAARRTLPALDAAFARRVAGAESMPELWERVRRHVADRGRRDARTAVQRDVLEQVANVAGITVSDADVAARLDADVDAMAAADPDNPPDATFRRVYHDIHREATRGEMRRARAGASLGAHFAATDDDVAVEDLLGAVTTGRRVPRRTRKADRAAARAALTVARHTRFWDGHHAAIRVHDTAGAWAPQETTR